MIWRDSPDPDAQSPLWQESRAHQQLSYSEACNLGVTDVTTLPVRARSSMFPWIVGQHTKAALSALADAGILPLDMFSVMYYSGTFLSYYMSHLLSESYETKEAEVK